MADIKTKNNKKDIKLLDKKGTVAQNMKNAFVRTKDHTENLMDDGQVSPAEYAEDKIQYAVEDVSRDVGRGVKDTGKKTVEKGRDLYRRRRETKKVGQTAKDGVKKGAEKGAKATKSTGKAATKTVKKSVKTTQKTVKTAQRTSKTAIKTTQQAVKAAQQTAKASVKTAKTAAQTAKVAAKAAVTTAKAAAKAIAAAVKAIIAGTKALIAAIAAGGWVAVVIIIVICLVGLLVGSIFGIFFSGDDSGSGVTMQTVVQEINDEYQAKIEEQKAKYTHDVLEMSGSRSVWPEVLAVYAVKTTTDPDNPQEVATMDSGKQALIAEIFWNMNAISATTEKKTETVITESDDGNGNIIVTETTVERTYLYITVAHKTADEMADYYGFNDEQRAQLAELLSEQNRKLWSGVLYGISGDGEIVSVALSQLGNIGGDPYWSWYGFDGRVEWCACFVSWCADQCGYIENGVIPKFAGCGIGVQWFKDRTQWQDSTYTPAPGDIIFFDWAADGKDGSADHVGIVERVDDGVVYTIEGNSGDACKQREYTLGYHEILGYGCPMY